MPRELGGGKEVFLVAVAAGGETAMAGDGLPEESRRRLIVGLPGQLIEAIEADELGNLRVGMEIVECVARLGHRIEHGMVAKALGQSQIFLVAGQDINVGENLVHPAMLGVEHALELLIGEVLRGGFGKVAEFYQYHERAGAGAIGVGIAQAGHDLVHGVPRDADDAPAGGDIIELRRAVGKGADQAGCSSGLTLLKLGDEVIAALLELGVGGGSIHHRASRQVMPQRVAVTADIGPGLHRFPSGIDRRLGIEAGIDAEIVKHSIGFEAQQIFCIALLRVEERPIQHAHVGERESLHGRGDGVQRAVAGRRCKRGDGLRGLRAGPAQRAADGDGHRAGRHAEQHFAAADRGVFITVRLNVMGHLSLRKIVSLPRRRTTTARRSAARSGRWDCDWPAGAAAGRGGRCRSIQAG